jgi:hypothetical protein
MGVILRRTWDGWEKSDGKIGPCIVPIREPARLRRNCILTRVAGPMVPSDRRFRLAATCTTAMGLGSLRSKSMDGRCPLITASGGRFPTRGLWPRPFELGGRPIPGFRHRKRAEAPKRDARYVAFKSLGGEEEVYLVRRMGDETQGSM